MLILNNIAVIFFNWLSKFFQLDEEAIVFAKAKHRSQFEKESHYNQYIADQFDNRVKIVLQKMKYESYVSESCIKKLYSIWIDNRLVIFSNNKSNPYKKAFDILKKIYKTLEKKHKAEYINILLDELENCF